MYYTFIYGYHACVQNTHDDDDDEDPYVALLLPDNPSVFNEEQRSIANRYVPRCKILSTVDEEQPRYLSRLYIFIGLEENLESSIIWI